MVLRRVVCLRFDPAFTRLSGATEFADVVGKGLMLIAHVCLVLNDLVLWI